MYSKQQVRKAQINSIITWLINFVRKLTCDHDYNEYTTTKHTNFHGIDVKTNTKRTILKCTKCGKLKEIKCIDNLNEIWQKDKQKRRKDKIKKKTKWSFGVWSCIAGAAVFLFGDVMLLINYINGHTLPEQHPLECAIGCFMIVLVLVTVAWGIHGENRDRINIVLYDEQCVNKKE